MDIIAAIDEATGCQYCRKPLGSSPSDDFCNEWCQRAWHAKHMTAMEDAPMPTPAPFATPAGYHAAIGGILGHLSRMHGVPPALLGFHVVEDDTLPPNSVYIRGNGTHYTLGDGS